MSKIWKKMDLSGNGLQTINLQFTAQKKDIISARFRALLFPVGLHQLYLRNYKKSALYITLTTAAALLQSSSPYLSLGVIIIEIILLTHDLWQLDDQVNQFNKNLKMQLSLQMDTSMPEGFKGRYTDNTVIDDYMDAPDQPNNPNTPNKKSTSNSRVYSFAEQEALLKAMQKTKTKTKTTDTNK